jgi:hypothetical protein
MDFIVKVNVPGTNVGNGVTVTDLMINQAIKLAVNENPVLKDFLIAQDGPSGTLIVMSKVDGESLKTDFTVSLGAADGAAPAGSGRVFGSLTGAELLALGFNPDGSPAEDGDGDGRWDAQFGTDNGKKLNGEDSINVNNNRVYGGQGNDEVALSSNGTSIEHYIIKDGENFGVDHVLNFTAAIADAIIPAETEVQEICVLFDDAGDDVTDEDVRISVTVQTAGGPVTVTTSIIVAGSDQATVNAAIEDAIDESGALNGIVEASINADTDCVELTYATGFDYGQVSTAILPVNPTEIQTFDITGTQSGPATVGIFGLPTITIPEGSSLTDVQIRDALITAINNLPGDLVTAQVGAGGDGTAILQVNFFTNADVAELSGLVVSPTVFTNITNISDVDDDFDPFEPGFTLEEATLNEGAPRIDPALGFDIFDVSDIIDVVVPQYFHNDLQDNSAGAEYAEVNALVDSGSNGVLLIDTLDGGAGEFAYTGSPANELARLQQMVTAADADGAGQTGTDTSVIITVHNLPGDPDGTIGNFYKVVDASGAGNATVTLLGTVYLGGYDDVSKDAIGNWDGMTIANFTPQTPTELMDTYLGGIIV